MQPSTDNADSEAARPRTGLGGLVRRRMVWAPTWRGWLAVFVLAATLLISAALTIHPFLAITERSTPDVLVIEGWIPDYALVDGWKEFQNGHYLILLTVGGPFRNGYDLDSEDDYADLAAFKLRKYIGKGIAVQAVRCPPTKRDRTFTCAVTVKAWLEQHHPSAAGVTIVTMGPHARRSRLLYEKVFGSKVDVGVIAMQNQEYDRHRWWEYSEGVKEIVSEGTAYFYTRLFFHPES
jgi:hypothetical protein